MLFGKIRKGNKNENNDSINSISNRTKIELAYSIQVAKGNRSVSEFINDMKMVDNRVVMNLLKKEYNELPDRKLLRRIADNSSGRITYRHLYDICGYSERDKEEDRSWMKWVPERGSVYMIDLGNFNIDSEQNSIRPAVVMQNDKGNQYSGTTVIIPISSRSKKFSSQIHVLLEKDLGFLRDCQCFPEQIRVVSKRRFFYNSVPHKITTLPDHKLKEIQTALEFELGFSPLMFNENHAFTLAEHIRSLEQNVRIKKSNNLINLLNEKVDELIEYCAKYRKNHNYILQEYDRINSYGIQVI